MAALDSQNHMTAVDNKAIVIQSSYLSVPESDGFKLQTNLTEGFERLNGCSSDLESDD